MLTGGFNLRPMSEKFLDKAYGLEGSEATRQFYDDWSTQYESEITGNGYATPGRIAAALARFAPDKSLPVLDFGCGTGLSGAALVQAGFAVIDGMDLSPQMLALARPKGIYRALDLVTPENGPWPRVASYDLITATGVIGVGAAPAPVFDDLMRGLRAGGLMAFSFNDHTLKDPAYQGRLMVWCDCGAAQLKFREHGPHLPGIGMKSTVYVIRKS